MSQHNLPKKHPVRVAGRKYYAAHKSPRERVRPFTKADHRLFALLGLKPSKVVTHLMGYAPLTPQQQAQLTIRQNRLRPGALRRARQAARKAA